MNKYLVFTELGGKKEGSNHKYAYHAIVEADDDLEAVIEWKDINNLTGKLDNDNNEITIDGNTVQCILLTESEGQNEWKKLVWVNKNINIEELENMRNFKLMHSNTIKNSLRKRVSNGKFNLSTPPYGYVIEGDELLVRTDDAPNVIRRIFEMYLKGDGTTTISRVLTEEKVPTYTELYAINQKSSGIWHDSTIRKILQNRSYIGDLVQFAETTDKESGRRIKTDAPIVIPYHHEPIVTKSAFDQVQKMILVSHPRGYKKHANNIHLFTSLLKCDVCGKSLTHLGKTNAYVCATYRKLGKDKCTMHKTLENKLIDEVYEHFKFFLEEDMIDLPENETKDDFVLSRALLKHHIEKVIVTEEGKCDFYFKNLNDHSRRNSIKKGINSVLVMLSGLTLSECYRLVEDDGLLDENLIIEKINARLEEVIENDKTDKGTNEAV